IFSKLEIDVPCIKSRRTLENEDVVGPDPEVKMFQNQTLKSKMLLFCNPGKI
ncbi:ankyrin repeat domain-containing protein 36B-like, partial [Daubentonia madagascariensis]